MSLIIKKTITTEQGIELNEICVRLDVLHHLQGDKIKVVAKEYATKTAFDNGAQPLESNFQKSQVFEYDRAVDGVDILQFAHEKFKQNIIETYKTEPIIEVVEGVETTAGTSYFFDNDSIEIVI